MPNRDNPSFPEIKKELIESVRRTEEYIKKETIAREEMMKSLGKLHIKIWGNDEAGIEGLEDRIRRLELVESERVKSKETLLKIAVGSMTVGIGGAVIWIFQVIRDAFIKVH